MATNVLLATPGGLGAACGQTGGISFTLNSAGASEDAVALLFTAPKTGDIDAIGFRINSVVGTSSDLAFSIQGVSAGNPDGTPISTEVTVSTIGTSPYLASSYNWVTLTPTPAAVTAKSEYAAVIRMTTADTSVTITTGLDGAASGSFAGSPHVRTQTNLTGWATTDDSIPTVAVRYSDGEILYGCVPYVTALANVSFGNDSTPDEKGVYWDVESDCTVYGADIAFRADGTGSAWDVHMYIGNAAASYTHSMTDEDLRVTGGMVRMVVVFDTPVSVTSGSRARIAVRPTVASATGTVRVLEWAFADADSREAVVGRLTRCDRSDGGAWDDTKTSQFIQITPVLSEASIAYGSGVSAGVGVC